MQFLNSLKCNQLLKCSFSIFCLCSSPSSVFSLKQFQTPALPLLILGAYQVMILVLLPQSAETWKICHPLFFRWEVMHRDEKSQCFTDTLSGHMLGITSPKVQVSLNHCSGLSFWIQSLLHGFCSRRRKIHMYEPLFNMQL